MKKGNNFFFNINNIILNEEDSLKEINNEEKEKMERKNKNENFNNNDINSGGNKNILKTKFFTDYNCSLKCSCFKTQCDKYYCECFRSRRYCINCNCRNCSNKPPKNWTSDKKNNINKELNIKDKKIFCTCSKSGCKYKYCECYKIGQECSDLCRCIKCENSKNPKINNNGIIKLLKICLVNSIKIANNQIFQEEREINNKKQFINKKRKKPGIKKGKKESQNDDEEENINKNGKKEKEKDNDNYTDDLFDKDGKMIFTHIKLSEIENLQKL